MLIFFILLTIGFIFELGKKALVIYSRQNYNKKLYNSSSSTLIIYLPIFLDCFEFKNIILLELFTSLNLYI